MNLKSITGVKLIVPLFVIFSLAAGLGVASMLNAFLNIRFLPKVLPVVPDYAEGREQSTRSGAGAQYFASISRPPSASLRIVDEGAVGIQPDWGNLPKDYSP